MPKPSVAQIDRWLVIAHLHQRDDLVERLLRARDRVTPAHKDRPGNGRPYEPSVRTGVTEAQGPSSKRIKQMRWMKDNLANQMDSDA